MNRSRRVNRSRRNFIETDGGSCGGPDPFAGFDYPGKDQASPSTTGASQNVEITIRRSDGQIEILNMPQKKWDEMKERQEALPDSSGSMEEARNARGAYYGNPSGSCGKNKVKPLKKSVSCGKKKTCGPWCRKTEDGMLQGFMCDCKS